MEKLKFEKIDNKHFKVYYPDTEKIVCKISLMCGLKSMVWKVKFENKSWIGITALKKISDKITELNKEWKSKVLMRKEDKEWEEDATALNINDYTFPVDEIPEYDD
jgi:hypothetical protein